MVQGKQAQGRHTPLRRMTIVERRLLVRERRLWHDFRWYMQRLLERLAMTDCLVTAKLHFGNIIRLNYQVAEGKVVQGKEEPGDSSAVATKVPVYSPTQCRDQLKARLTRLTRECNIRFGRIMVIAESGKITGIHFNESLRPEEGGERHFRSEGETCGGTTSTGSATADDYRPCAVVR